ncbi:MAG: DUF4906 domain-containing protein [Bacteroides sp.]|nr:DUF4906 domain-containing protein [Bacteroides sp.]
MRIKNNDKKLFRAVCIVLFSLAFTGCTKDNLNEFGPGNITGKVVMVSLNVSLPPSEEPTSADEYATVKPFFKNENNSDSSFTVVLEREQRAATTRVSDGTTKLHNLWLLTLDGLKNWSFEYLTNVEGHTQSLITADDEVPFAGEVSGITVMDIDGGDHGLVEYNKPVGFVGGIEIRKLMARITFRYKLEVENYKLQGLKLLNVNSKVRLTNPEKNTDKDTYVTFEIDEFDEPDPNGFYSATWYVAQNCQGTVASIASESQRYYKVVNGVSSGSAPILGMQIEAWAYSTSTSATGEYAIYQMYIGNNNTNNFDVKPNHFYNLRTTINADINSAKNDERIRAYTVSQYVEFHASKNVSVSGGKFDNKYNTSSEKYDLDAAYEVRPIVVQTQGRMVEVGVYTDESCTQHPTPSWLRLSSSSNYTDAYNNAKEPLGTYIKASTILPTQLKFYLYNDEYIDDGEGNFLDPGADATEGKRSLYIKITTTTNGDAGEALQTSHIFRLDQRAAIYLGRLGGERNGDGNYTMGLVYTRMSLRSTSWLLADVKPGTTRTGYARIKTAELSYGTDNMDNGKTATRHLAENTYNQNWIDKYVPIPQKDASGHVLLYQYQYPASTFSARACYDRNRDENGDGIIDEKEFKWYLPASNQLLGICVAALPGLGGGTSTTEFISPPYCYFIAASSGNFWSPDRDSGLDRCVRDVTSPFDAPY